LDASDAPAAGCRWSSATPAAPSAPSRKEARRPGHRRDPAAVSRLPGPWSRDRQPQGEHQTNPRLRETASRRDTVASSNTGPRVQVVNGKKLPPPTPPPPPHGPGGRGHRSRETWKRRRGHRVDQVLREMGGPETCGRIRDSRCPPGQPVPSSMKDLTRGIIVKERTEAFAGCFAVLGRRTTALAKAGGPQRVHEDEKC